jgi:hypothetical protein
MRERSITNNFLIKIKRYIHQLWKERNCTNRTLIDSAIIIDT